MLEVVKTPQARRLWRVCREFNLLPSDPRIQALNEFDIEFIEYSLIADNPEMMKRLSESFYDNEFDAFWENPDSDDLGASYAHILDKT